MYQLISPTSRHGKQLQQMFATDENFLIYETSKMQNAKLTVKIDKLMKYIVQSGRKNKEDRYLIIFNRFKGVRRIKDDALLPHIVMLDFDFKDAQQQMELMDIFDEKTFQGAFMKLSELFRNDPLTLYMDVSHSGVGLKVLIRVVSDYYKQYKDVYKNEDGGEKALRMHKYNYMVVAKYLEDKYNIPTTAKFHDIAALKVTQGTYSSNGRELVLNPQAATLYYKGDDDIWGQGSLKEYINRKVEQVTRKPHRYVAKQNADFISLLKRIYDKYPNELLNDLKPYFSHYNDVVLWSLVATDSVATSRSLEWLYEHVIKVLYSGTSIDTRTYDRFIRYLRRVMAPGFKFANTLRFILTEYKEIQPKLQLHKYVDLYGRVYDENLKFNQYIIERDKDIKRIIDAHDFTVLKAAANSGKSTYMRQYMYDMIASGQMNVIAYAIPTNMLLEQQFEAFRRDFIAEHPDMHIYRNYGGHKEYKGKGRGIILTSTPGYKRIEDMSWVKDDGTEGFKLDLLVIDEIQNLVNYSSAIYSNIRKQDIKIVAISATPEKYLIFEDNYYYVNLQKNNVVKKELTMYHTYRPFNSLMKLVRENESKQILVLLNDKDKSEKHFNGDNYNGMNWVFLNSDNLNEPYMQKIIKEERLDRQYVCTTSVSMDGINYNDTGDIVLIVVNTDILVAADEVYQMSERFRKANNITIYYVLTMRPPSDAVCDFDKFNDMELFEKLYERAVSTLGGLGQTNPYQQSGHVVIVSNGKNVQVEVNKDALKRYAYVKYYYNAFVNDYEVQRDSFNYYFTVKHYINKNKDKNKIYLGGNELEPYSDVIEGLSDVVFDYNNGTPKEWEMAVNKLNIKGKFKNMLKLNFNISMELLKRIEVAKQYGMPWHSITYNGNNFMRALNLHRMRYVGNKVKPDALVPGIELRIWELQEAVYKAIVKSKCYTQTKRGNVVDVNAALEIVRMDDEVMEIQQRYLDDFMLFETQTALVTILKSTTRWFEARQLQIKNERHRVIIMKPILATS